VIVGIDLSSGYGIVLATAGGIATVGAAATVLVKIGRALKSAVARRRREKRAFPHADRDAPVELGGEAPAIDAVGLLRQQYAAGRKLQEALIWALDASADMTAQAHARERSRDRVCAWAKETWQILDRHFPAYEAAFYGERRPLGASYFAIACADEIKKSGGNEHDYLAVKVEYLGDVLRAHDAPPSYISSSQRTVERCLSDALALRAVIGDTNDWSRADDLRRQVDAWAEDTSTALRRDVSRYSNWFTRIRLANGSHEELAGYLDMRIEELRRIIQQLSA
jgi:hypothetical protein